MRTWREFLKALSSSFAGLKEDADSWVRGGELKPQPAPGYASGGEESAVLRHVERVRLVVERGDSPREQFGNAATA